MSGGFQQQVYDQPAMGVAGDFASQNPYFTVDAGPGGLVAGGPNGVTIGRFAWVYPPFDPNGAGKIVQNFGAGPVAGFVHRAQQGLITTYLQFAGMQIMPGFQMTLMNGGDFLVVNDGVTQALVGQKAYADFSTGKVRFGVSGAPIASAEVTGAIAPASINITGSIIGGVLTVAATSGFIPAGAVLSGSGVAAGTRVTGQVSGPLGGVGVYNVSIPEQNVAPGTAITAAYGVLTVSAVASGVLEVGAVLAGAAPVTANTTISQLGTGLGAEGTYYVNISQNAGSGTITAVGDVETKWSAMSSGLAGELVKISDHPLG